MICHWASPNWPTHRHSYCTFGIYHCMSLVDNRKEIIIFDISLYIIMVKQKVNIVQIHLFFQCPCRVDVLFFILSPHSILQAIKVNALQGWLKTTGFYNHMLCSRNTTSSEHLSPIVVLRFRCRNKSYITFVSITHSAIDPQVGGNSRLSRTWVTFNNKNIFLPRFHFLEFAHYMVIGTTLFLQQNKGAY